MRREHPTAALNPALTPFPTSGNKNPTEDDLQAEATRIDAARASQDRANPVDQVIDPAAAGDVPNVEAQPVADPSIVIALTFLVSTGVRLLHTRYDWTEPDEEWKAKVAELGALCIDKYMPDFLKNQGPLTALVLVVSPYVIENSMRAAAAASDGDRGGEGVGKDNFVIPPLEDALTRSAHPA